MAVFKASPEDVYALLMDSKKHSMFTKSKAVISKKEGGAFSAYDGGLRGKNVKLIPGKMIVQLWRCDMKGWPKKHFSVAVFFFNKFRKGTRLDFIQTDVPEECYGEISKGWKKFYWQPMKRML